MKLFAAQTSKKIDFQFMFGWFTFIPFAISFAIARLLYALEPDFNLLTDSIDSFYVTYDFRNQTVN